MEELFSDLPDALENANEIVKRCNVKIEVGKSHLPRIKLPVGQSPDQILRDEAHKGLKRFIASELAQERLIDESTYRERVDFELQVINQMGFDAYFLIVQEIMIWAREREIPVGIRGSGNASLVSFVIGISNIDPLKYDLLFERLLNPERVSLPDFDIDICMLNRQRVIDHVTDVYGEQAVAQVVSFNTLAAKAVVRDVTRVLGLPFSKGAALAELIPPTPNVKLDDVLKNDKRVTEMERQDPDIQQILYRAKALEGLVRNLGRHAGGLVIAPSELTDFVSYYTESPTGDAISQFDKADVEDIGLVKFDLLGLKTLTVIDQTIRLVNTRLPVGAAPIKLETIPVDDVETFNMISKAETIGVFQLESQGMRTQILELEPDCLDDLIALVALYRPGPLIAGADKKYSRRKHGEEEFKYPHPSLESVLNKTYGLMLYQEDAMSVSRTLAGFSLGEADIMRRAMAKKEKGKMEQLRQDFVNGAVTRNVDAKVAEAIFDDMKGFSDYGFPKSHATAYAIIANQTAWLKCRYPAEFMTVTLTHEMQDVKQLCILLSELQRLGVNLITPDVNVSNFNFTLNEDGICWGLGALKGVGEDHAQTITEARKAGKFEDLFDFCSRVDTQTISRDVILTLINSGAMDSLATEIENKQLRRATLEFHLERSYLAAVQWTRIDQSRQIDMFGGKEEVACSFDSSHVEPWSLRKLINEEIKSLGTNISGHPVDEFEKELRSRLPRTLAMCKLQDREEVEVLCRVLDSGERSGRDNRIRLIGEVDDGTDRIPFTVFDGALEGCKQVLKNGSVVVLYATVKHDKYGQVRLICSGAKTLNAFRADQRATFEFRIDSVEKIDDFLMELQNTIPFEGEGEKPELLVQTCDYDARIRLGNSCGIRVTQDAIDLLSETLDDVQWEIKYPR